MVRTLSRLALAASLTLAVAACSSPSNDPDAFDAVMPDGNEQALAPEVAPPPADATVKSIVLNEPPTDPIARQAILDRYKHLDPTGMVPKNLLEKAILTFDVNQASFPNKATLGIVDFSQRSNKARWFVIDLKTGSVWAIHVAHGTKSDEDNDGWAESFSNEFDSNKSSLGVYRTAETYQSSKFGYALRVDGLSPTNSNVRERAIVIHSAWYVLESNVKPGRTQGCLGVSSSLSKKLIDLIKDGSMVMADLSGTKLRR